jgi:bifunctional DNA-binding transcriptional regulator/antitoxin component of YhaV-PrlF toxin-antitoxin module
MEYVLDYASVARKEAVVAPLRLKLESNGRVLLPADVRRQLGVSAGDTLLAALDADGLRIWTQAIALRQAQSFVSEFVPGNVSLVDELLAGRREDAKTSDEKLGIVPRPKGRGRK